METATKNVQLKESILRKLYYSGTVSLTTLSRQTHKSLPVVTQAVGDLVEDGILTERGVAPSTGGRRPAVFLFSDRYVKYLVCVAMDQFVARVAIYDQFKNRRTDVGAFEVENFGSGSWLSDLMDFIDDHISSSGIARTDILGVGIGMPGFVNKEKGINESLALGKDFKLRDHIAGSLSLPVYIENDSSLIALAELRLGAGQSTSNIMVVNIGWGTGLGMIIGGELYRGHSNYAGEFSHIPLSESETLCSCGKRGCLEVETSILAMVRKANQRIEEGEVSLFTKLVKDKSKIAGDHFLAAAGKGDPLVVSILSESAYVMGKGIATLIHILNPEKIVLSGRGSQAGKMYMPAIQQAINVFCIQKIAEETILEVSSLGHEAELLGAACLVIDNCTFHGLK